MPFGTYVVVLTVPDEQALKELASQLPVASYRLIIENGQGYRGQAMALGTKPKPKSEQRRWFSTLPLLR